jgi:3-oxoadipate enol-lactonase
MAYAIVGHEDAPTVLLSHALATRMEVWGYQLPLLTPYFRVVLYDLRGHGESDALSDRCTFSELSDDVVSLLDYLGIDEVAFVGLSLGGMVGQVFALEHPERASALVLCSTGSQTSGEAREKIQQRIDTARHSGLAPLVEATLERWFTPAYRVECSEVMAWIAWMIQGTSVEGFIGCCRALQTLDTSRKLDRLKIPVLLMPGELDQAFTPAMSAQIQSKISGSRLSIVPGAAHLGNVEAAHAFNEPLSRFLRETLL